MHGSSYIALFYICVFIQNGGFYCRPVLVAFALSNSKHVYRCVFAGAVSAAVYRLGKSNKIAVLNAGCWRIFVCASDCDYFGGRGHPHTREN